MKLNTYRLYKVIKIAVIATTVIALSLAYLSFNTWHDVTFLQTELNYCDKIFTDKRSDGWVSCNSNAFKENDSSLKSEIQIFTWSLAIGISTPLLFLLIRYLFTENKKKD